MINIDKTDVEKDELELWEEITKGDKKYKKSNYLKSAKIIKKSKIKKQQPNLKVLKAEKNIKPKVFRKKVVKENKLENLSPEKIPSGISLRQAENLKRGKFKPEIIIDLHGFSSVRARELINEKILQSYYNNIRCILIITGKKFGPYGSEGILKREVPGWLNLSPLREKVLMTSWATSQHGGQGALYVLLKKVK